MAGSEPVSWVAGAMRALPREAFAPATVWDWDGAAYVPVDRGADPVRWRALVDAGPDTATVTQVTGGQATCSLSCPAVVEDMLRLAAVEPGRRVLELGTGTGWNAALAGWRTGPGRVASVEVDPVLAREARRRLEDAEVGVAVHEGDGAAGWPDGGPYDAVVATYAVEAVPWAWVKQCRPGGRVVAPWGLRGHLALTVADDGRSASGRVAGMGAFMASRSEPVRRGWADTRGTSPAENERPFPRDVAALRSWSLLMALRVLLPDVRVFSRADSSAAWLYDGVASWATVDAAEGAPVVYQGGPRRLADEVEAAWDWWSAAGCPAWDEWGLTATRDQQFAWCREAGPRWPVAGGDRAVA